MLTFNYVPISDENGVSELTLEKFFNAPYGELPWLVESCNCIYLVTNLVTGELYIGQTTYLYRRFRLSCTSHKFSYEYGASNPIYDEMYTYGLDNFKVEVLEANLNRSELDSREIYWVSYFNSFKKGYNRTEGGHTNHRMNDESVIKWKLEEYDGDIMGPCRTAEALER